MFEGPKLSPFLLPNVRESGIWNSTHGKPYGQNCMVTVGDHSIVALACDG